MLVALCSDKGSPGTTTCALTLASAWGSAVVVEADPGGGDLGIRLHPGGNALPEAPTVLSLAAAARAGADPSLVKQHAQRLNSSVPVVPGPLRREQMAKVGDWTRTAEVLRDTEPAVVADLGQMHAASPVLPIATAAEVVVVVGRPDMTSVIRLRDRMTRLAADLGAFRGRPPKLYALLVSPPRHGEANANDLAALLRATAANPFTIGVGYIADDPAAVRRLQAGDDPTGRLARTHLMRSARVVVADLSKQLAEPGTDLRRSVVGSIR